MVAAPVAPAITSAAPPGGIVGTAYSSTYTATGTAPITYSVTAGTLPGGLTLTGAGVLSGTPTTAGTFAGTVTAGNGTLPDATQAFSIVVTPAVKVPELSGGSSAVDPWSLAFLGGLPLLRRWRSRKLAASSKRLLKPAAALTVAVTVTALLAGPAVAADWDWDYQGLYLGAGAIGTSLKGGKSLDEDLGASGILGSFEDFPIGWQLYGGWMFTRNLGLEFRVSDSGNGQTDVLLRDTGTGATTNIGNAKLSMNGYTAYVVGDLPFADRWSVYGKLGWTWQDLDGSISADGGPGFVISGSDTRTDNGIAAAIGARFRFARHWATSVEGEYLGVNFNDAIDEPWRVGLNIEYWFGGHEIARPVAAAVVAAPVVAKAAPPPPAPKDSDGDGVLDVNDQCPDTPKGDRVGAQGCSCDVSRQVTFKTNSAELTAEGQKVLDEMAENLTRLHFVAGTIEGHTDSTGSDAYNQKLSERRAKTVSDYLQAKGIAQGRMNVVGMGESQPIGDNKTKEGRAQNRRVVAKRTDCDK